MANLSLKANKPKQKKEDVWKKTMNRLTNWQRSQWHKAGRPGLKELQVKKLLPFADLKHWKSRAKPSQ